MSEGEAIEVILELSWRRGMGALTFEDRVALAGTETFLRRRFDGSREDPDGTPLAVVAVVSMEASCA
jgi:hypothetical protein